MTLTGLPLPHARSNHSTCLTSTLITSTRIMLTIKSGKMLKPSRKARLSFVEIASSNFSKGTTTIKTMFSLAMCLSLRRRTPPGRSYCRGQPRWLLRVRMKTIAPLVTSWCSKLSAAKEVEVESHSKSKKKYDKIKPPKQRETNRHMVCCSCLERSAMRQLVLWDNYRVDLANT